MRQCPVDDFTLKPMEYEDVAVDICLHCGGVWLDAGELEILQKTQDSDFRGVPRSELDSVTAADGMAQSRGEGARDCVSCKDPMEKCEYAFSSQVMIDRCSKGHGIWLDKGELARLESFYEDQHDFSKVLDSMEKEGSGLTAFVSRLMGLIRS